MRDGKLTPRQLPTPLHRWVGSTTSRHLKHGWPRGLALFVGGYAKRRIRLCVSDWGLGLGSHLRAYGWEDESKRGTS
jgi:hypothetical protein